MIIMVEELTKKYDDLGELKEINKDIVSSIKLQKKNNEDYIRELLRQIETEKEANIKLNEDITELNLLSQNMVSTIATLEAEYNECAIGKIIQNGIREKRTYFFKDRRKRNC
ncbi:hypothetical protein JTB14_021891 [Gonioctena quinquepunctata]|nr:hypothetical protein JTB14_021891 [Gonioctena quinquepunctata]